MLTFTQNKNTVVGIGSVSEKTSLLWSVELTREPSSWGIQPRQSDPHILIRPTPWLFVDNCGGRNHYSY